MRLRQRMLRPEQTNSVADARSSRHRNPTSNRCTFYTHGFASSRAYSPWRTLQASRETHVATVRACIAAAKAGDLSSVDTQLSGSWRTGEQPRRRVDEFEMVRSRQQCSDQGCDVHNERSSFCGMHLCSPAAVVVLCEAMWWREWRGSKCLCLFLGF